MFSYPFASCLSAQNLAPRAHIPRGPSRCRSSTSRPRGHRTFRLFRRRSRSSWTWGRSRYRPAMHRINFNQNIQIGSVLDKDKFAHRHGDAPQDHATIGYWGGFKPYLFNGVQGCGKTEDGEDGVNED